MVSVRNDLKMVSDVQKKWATSFAVVSCFWIGQGVFELDSMFSCNIWAFVFTEL